MTITDDDCFVDNYWIERITLHIRENPGAIVTGRAEPAQPAGAQARTPSWLGEVAQELNRLGIGVGDLVAVIGYGFDS